jgi:phosphatidylglycerophosphate synthase
LTNLCGISLLERWCRTVQKLGFREAMILSNSAKSIAASVAKSSCLARNLSLKFREQTDAEATVGDVLDCLSEMNLVSARRFLIVFAGFYCDERLLRALTEARTNSALIDSQPPPLTSPVWDDSEARSCACSPCVLISSEWLLKKKRAVLLGQELASDAAAGRVVSVDAAHQEAYLPGMRRSIRPVFFPAPSAEQRPLAERLVLDTTQKGVLDLPALAHAPIENWIVSYLWRTSITPNQVTFATAVIGLGVTLLYAFGHLGAGALLAAAVGVLDGVDGKLARAKVQTTEIGKGEHVVDYFIEMSWWTALARHFQVTGQVPCAYVILLVFFAFDWLGRGAKGFVMRQTGRTLDDASPVDRSLRYIAGRRNIYTWLFISFLLIGAPAAGFIALCCWGMASGVIHAFRATQLGLRRSA